MSFTSIQQFEDAVFMLRWIAYEQLKKSAGQVQNPKLVHLLSEIDADLLNRVDPLEVRAKYGFGTGELVHARGNVRGPLHALPFELAKWRVESQSYALSSTDQQRVYQMDAPLVSVPFPNKSFSLEIKNPIMDRLGNPFRVLLVSITRPENALHGSFFMTLTTVSDNVSEIHSKPIETMYPNDLVRSIDLNLNDVLLSPSDLFESLQDKFLPWSFLKHDVARFWMTWLSCIQYLANTVQAAKMRFVPQFNPSVPPAHFPHQQPLPPLPMLQANTAFEVAEASIDQNTQRQPSDQLGGHHQGREQRPSFRRGHWRRKRGQGNDPNGELIQVRGYETKKEMLAPGVPLIGSRTLLN